MFNLANYYDCGAPGERVPDPARAARWYRRAAVLGHAPAMCSLGALLAEGRGVARPDLGEAQRWWTEAAAKGDAHAQTNLAVLLARQPQEQQHQLQKPQQAVGGQVEAPSPQVQNWRRESSVVAEGGAEWM
jgi:TPR repeat protein